MASLNYYRSDGWVKTTLGPAVSGAQIYVLQQPANVTPPITPPRTIPVPFVPNPQALIYSDDGITPIVQPVITDGFGHYDFYVLPGLYTVAVYYGGQLQQFYVDQSIGNVGSAQSTSLLLSTNGTPNFNQFVQNLQQGPNIILVTDNLGNTTISGAANPSQLQPTPDVSQWRMWEAENNGSIWDAYGETIAVIDGGAANAYVAPTAIAGASQLFTVTANQFRYYIGNLFAYPSGRTLTFSAIVTPGYSNIGAGGVIRLGFSDATSNEVSFYAAKTAGGPWSNWQIMTLVGGVNTLTDTGVAATSSRVRLSYSISAAGEISFNIGGSTGTASPTLPTTPLGIVVFVESTLSNPYNLTAAVEYIYGTNATP